MCGKVCGQRTYKVEASLDECHVQDPDDRRGYRAVQLVGMGRCRSMMIPRPPQRVQMTQRHVQPVCGLLPRMTADANKNFMHDHDWCMFRAAQREFEVLAVCPALAKIEAADSMEIAHPDDRARRQHRHPVQQFRI
jgi:hypothetical protein